MPTRYTYWFTPVPYIRTHLFPDPAHARRYTPDGRAQRLSAALEAVFHLARVVVLSLGAVLVAVRVGNALVEYCTMRRDGYTVRVLTAEIVRALAAHRSAI